jgi:signal peptidase II
MILAGVVIAGDQWTKCWALSHLDSAGRSLELPGPVDLTLSLNRSNAFGLTPVVGELTRWGLTAANLAAAATILFMIFRKTLHPLTTFGLALVVAGAIGNAVDRIRLGAVVDFIDATKIGFVWIFNVADATVDAGIALLALSLFLSRPAKA